MTSTSQPSAPVVPPVAVLPPVIAPPQILRQGDMFVVASGCDLPRRCLKCNAQVEGDGSSHRLKWRPDPGIVGRLPFVRTVHNLTTTQTGVLTVYLCPAHRKRMTLWANGLIALACCIGVAVVLWIAINQTLQRQEGDVEKFIGGLGIWAAIISFVCSFYFQNATLDMKHADAGYIWVKGAGEAFLASLPEVPA